MQSEALRLVCDRERAIRAFVPEEYWSLTACLEADKPPRFAARLIKRSEEDIKPGNADQMETVLVDLDEAEFRVARADKKPQRRNPYPPFITSTLQVPAITLHVSPLAPSLFVKSPSWKPSW